MNTLLGVGITLVIGSGALLFRKLNQCVVIKKHDFKKIETRIREDERRRTLEDVNIGKVK